MILPTGFGKLTMWKHYIKGEGRRYPVKYKSFQNWIKLDFDDDGKSGLSQPISTQKRTNKDKLDLDQK